MTALACSHCGRIETKWYPQCPTCKAFSSFSPATTAQLATAAQPPAAPIVRGTGAAQMHVIVAERLDQYAADPIAPRSYPVPITQIDMTIDTRIPCGIEPVDRVLGGEPGNYGMVTGSAILIGGAPGCGKSTLTMQLLAGVGLPILYASAEESLAQIAMRARRIDASVERIALLAETDIDQIIEHAREARPAILVVDSIQTVTTESASGIPGSVAQVKACASKVVAFGKANGIIVILIGHVTKDGALAGPKTLEHLVDVTLSLTIDEEISKRIRFLGAHKNRYGTTMETGALEMTARGMVASDELPRGDGDEPRDRDEIYQPLAQELLNRYLAGGGNVDAGLRDRIGELLDMEMWRETR